MHLKHIGPTGLIVVGFRNSHCEGRIERQLIHGIEELTGHKHFGQYDSCPGFFKSRDNAWQWTKPFTVVSH